MLQVAVTRVFISKALVTIIRFSFRASFCNIDEKKLNQRCSEKTKNIK